METIQLIKKISMIITVCHQINKSISNLVPKHPQPCVQKCANISPVQTSHLCKYLTCANIRDIQCAEPHAGASVG